MEPLQMMMMMMMMMMFTSKRTAFYRLYYTDVLYTCKPQEVKKIRAFENTFSSTIAQLV
jgi:hypothetical protein